MDVSGMTIEGFFLADYARKSERVEQLEAKVKELEEVWRGAPAKYDFARPHDHIGDVIGDLLPRESDGGGEFLEFMKKSWNVLVDHPVNRARRERGLKAANSAWLIRYSRTCCHRKR